MGKREVPQHLGEMLAWVLEDWGTRIYAELQTMSQCSRYEHLSWAR